jgi:integrase/recombinase XerD
MKLSDAVEKYVIRKRESGLKFVAPAAIFRSFVKSTGDADLAEIATSDVQRFLDGLASVTFSWRAKHQLLTQFFDFWAIRDAIVPLVMPSGKPPAKRTFLPHIYSRTQIRCLLRAASNTHQRYKESISPQTLRTVILFLYATGANLGEGIGLKCRDIDFARSTVILRNRYSKQRTIPVCRDLIDAIKKYDRWKSRRVTRCDSFFIKNDGNALIYSTLNGTFRGVCRVASVRRNDGSDPVLQDLRPTFAVHRISSWIRNGADLDRLLPALSVYMGFAGLCATQKYVAMTPERFREELAKLTSIRRRGQWGRDKDLMKFLDTLTKTVRSSRAGDPCVPMILPRSSGWRCTR